MSDWRYALKVPTSPWRSAMSIPRKLTVVGSGDELALTTYPIDALHALQREQITYDLPATPALRTFGPVRGAAFDWQLHLKNQNQSKFEVVLSNASGQQTRLSIDPIHSEATFDRSNSGIVNFDSHFSDLVKIPWLTRSETTELRIIVDQSSIEIFIDGGRNVITGLIFPDSIYDRVQIAGDNNVEVSAATLAILDSIWAEPKHN
jgi:fructan beta-fructosidase